MPSSCAILGDCLDRMADIPDGSVDMILTDLPYGVLTNNKSSSRWDCPLPLDRLWAEYLRVAKQNAAIVLFGQGMFTAELMMSQPKLWRYNLIWEKDRPTGFLNAKRMPHRSHEDIAVFYRSLPTFNPQMIPCLPSERIHPRGNGQHAANNRHYGTYRDTESIVRDEKYPKSVIRIPREHRCTGKTHPTQKPTALCDWLIRSYSNEGDVVLDSCMGSGTTGVSCAHLGRGFIGIEADDEFYATAIERITEARGGMPPDTSLTEKR